MPSAEKEAPLQLLLTEADEYIPVLADGLDERLLERAPRPEREERPVLESHGADPNDLPAQRWGVVAPQGEHGDRMLAAIDALIQHRRTQQGAVPQLYRVPPDMDLAAATSWRDKVLRAEGVPEEERPRYLLLLGDLHEVSLELQHVLAAGVLLGRLQCLDLAGFRRYAEKVVQAELAEATARPHALYYTAEDGSFAVELGRELLVDPCVARTREGSETGRLALAGVLEVPHGDGQSAELMRLAGATEHAVLLSVSHGLGAPRKGWRSPEEQRARQGALFLGVEELTAGDLADAPFLPSGVWFSLACFSAGTPPASAFHPWLTALAADGRSGAPDVLRSLPRPGERPFIAALPQAALANPQGPLAVIGHIDLAWTFGFTDPVHQDSRASRVYSTLRTLLAGGRAGVALDALMRTYRDTNDDLMSRYHRQRDAAARQQPDPENPRQLGRLWLQRNDLRGYILLGDPAVRLAVAPPSATRRDREPNGITIGPPRRDHEPDRGIVARPPTRHDDQAAPPHDHVGDVEAGRVRVADSRPAAPSPRLDPRPVVATPPPSSPSPVSAELAERAVLALLHGDEAPREIAARFGISVAELFLWLDRYRHAGRSGLAG